jgi:hypothetical protein
MATESLERRTALQRIKRRQLLWGTSILLLVIIIVLGIVQARQAGQRSSLSEDLEIAEQVLSALESEQSSSGQDETGTQQGDAGIAKAELSQPADSIMANEDLFYIADASSVTLTTITVSSLSNDTLAELPCLSLPLSIVAEGDEGDLLDFITRLNTELTNGLVRSATITIPAETAGSQPTVNIELVIYTYQGG